MSEQEKLPAVLEPSPVENVSGVAGGKRVLSEADFDLLSDLPDEAEWYANLGSERTRHEYRTDLRLFLEFVGKDFSRIREIRRPHVILWRDELKRRGYGDFAIGRKLATLSSLFNFLCDKNAVEVHPVIGVKRPKPHYNEGRTADLASDDAAKLLEAPPSDTLKGARDRAILAVLLFHALRRQELVRLKVGSIQLRAGYTSFKVEGKGDKIRYVLAHPIAQTMIAGYLKKAGHGDDLAAPLFKPVSNNRFGDLDKPMSPRSINYLLEKWAKKAGVHFPGLKVHSLRSTAATNALDHEASLDEVRKWMGHANVQTTLLYVKSQQKPEKSPTFKVFYQ